MCWIGKCNIKIAKRDFYVYKLGSVSYKGFESLYQDFIYEPKEINKKVELNPIPLYKDKSFYAIYEGYHSYKDVVMPYSDLRSCCRTIYFGNIKLNHYPYNIYHLATFIIPKGSIYYENIYGEIVSSNIIYTGKHLKL